MKFCTKCGAELSETDKFCQTCGEKSFNAPIAPQAQVSADFPPANRRKAKPLAVIIPAAAVLILILVLVLVLSGNGNSSPTAVVQKYLNAYSSGDINAMLGCIEPEAAAQYSESAPDLFENYPDFIDKTRIISENTMGGSAAVIVEVTFEEDDGSHTNVNIIVPCKEIDGKWYMSIA